MDRGTRPSGERQAVKPRALTRLLTLPFSAYPKSAAHFSLLETNPNVVVNQIELQHAGTTPDGLTVSRP